MAANFEEQREFTKWVLNIGDNSLFAIVEEKGINLDWIKFLSHMRLLVKDYNLRGLIQTIYPDDQHHSRDAMYIMQCNVLALKKLTLMKSTMQFLNRYLKNCTST